MGDGARAARRERTSRYVLDLKEIEEPHAALVGGKAARLGELSRIEGIRVPQGFCVTTEAYRRVVAGARSLRTPLDRLSRLEPGDRSGIRALSAEVRRTVESLPLPDDLATAIGTAMDALGGELAVAVRSSATAEDLSSASFAGQYDTYLNVLGSSAVLRHVGRCWGSVFTERAVAYRLQNRVDHRGVLMAVVVQRMIVPDAAGVLFTADPATGNRTVVAVEACFGLGEALVSGRAAPDVYRVREGEVLERTIAAKRFETRPAAGGGTEERPVEAPRREQPVLTDAELLRLARLGRRIERHFRRPQDVEWCLRDDQFHILQARPITTLFPVPDAGDGSNRVYVSVGHQQMMTDAMKPLGLSFWQRTTPRPMGEAGGRLFVDVTGILSSPVSRAGFLEMAGRTDPLIRDAVESILRRGDFIPSAPEGAEPGWAPPSAGPEILDPDASIVAGLIARSEQSVAALKRDIRGRSGSALLDFIEADLQELRRILFDPVSRRAVMTGMEAAWWLNDRMAEWLGETNAADVLSRSVPGNVTSEMGLALLDVADAIRPHREVVDYLRDVEDDDFLDDLPGLPGGVEARAAIDGWLARYGMRGVGEIDITRPRWSECPAALVPLIVGNVDHFERGEARRRFERGRRDAREKERALLARLGSLPEGDRKAEETRRMIRRLRTFAGYREYPKYGMTSRYFVYKQALLAEAASLVDAAVIPRKEDVFYLRFEELREAVRTREVDAGVIRQRREAFRSYRALTPPRVLTSDGEIVAGSYRRADVPSGSLVGLAVSGGTVEGRARILRDPAEGRVGPGDILVTAYTDPSWTPLFVAIGGLVTEVGGLMTHGAVIAREYGIPAVVGVDHATGRIRDGERIRVHGTEGYVEILT